MIRVGDRVRFIKENYGRYLYGKEGICLDIEGYSFMVEFDEKFEGGHDCGKIGKDGHCWYCSEDWIEVADFIQF